MKHLPKSSWFRWAVDDPKEMESLGLGLIRSRSFADADPELIRYLPWPMRLSMRWAPWVEARMTQGYRLNRFEIREA